MADPLTPNEERELRALVTGKGRNAGTKERWAEVMGWPDFGGTQHGLREAIPPDYARWIGLHSPVMELAA